MLRLLTLSSLVFSTLAAVIPSEAVLLLPANGSLTGKPHDDFSGFVAGIPLPSVGLQQTFDFSMRYPDNTTANLGLAGTFCGAPPVTHDPIGVAYDISRPGLYNLTTIVTYATPVNESTGCSQLHSQSATIHSSWILVQNPQNATVTSVDSTITALPTMPPTGGSPLAANPNSTTTVTFSPGFTGTYSNTTSAAGRNLNVYAGGLGSGVVVGMVLGVVGIFQWFSE